MQRKGTGRPLTISEHAVESRRLLCVHRIVHSLPLIMFTPLIIGYLIPNGYIIAATLLGSAAVFDSLETLTLNERTAKLDNGLNLHSFTAWIMSLSYLLYAVIISQITGVSTWIYGTAMFVCVILLICGATGILKRYFLYMQMSYFLVISFIGILAYIELIIA